MHFESLPKVTHDEDAIREYEREENQQIAKWLKRGVWFAIPIAIVIVWFITR